MSSGTTRFVTVDGMRLRVRLLGSGPPLLLVMGLGGSIELWDPFVRAIEGRETISYDAPGTGESDLPAHPLRMGQLAGVAERLIDQLGYERVDVLGLSFGGAVAQQLAFQSPQRVGRLILAATAFGLGSVLGNPLAMAILFTPYRYYSRGYLDLVAPFLYGGGARRSLMDQQALARLHRPPSIGGYYMQLMATVGWSSLLFLGSIRQPTLVMAGDDDPIVPLANGHILAREIPNARLHVVKGGGHLFLLERADESAEVIRRFLDASEDADYLKEMMRDEDER
jgi:poly(3-hydroxyalkanoate) depolymerase